MTLNQTWRNQGCSEALNVVDTDKAISGPISTTAHDGTPTGNADSTINPPTLPYVVKFWCVHLFHGKFPGKRMKQTTEFGIILTIEEWSIC